ncbi:MAG TPA: hypothetical protein ENK60_08795 [Anaerolineae bacterium]|nr:hypothetical protein [Anaerolineae bacterium]
MNGSTLAELQSNILFWIIIALFAWQGYQRGLIAELVKMGFILIGFFVGNREVLGKTLIKALNGFWLALQFLIHGGFEAIVTGNFNAETLSKIFEEINKLPPLIPPDRMEIALFLAMLFLIGLGYLISKLFKPQWPGLGLVAGALNGFLLSYIFLPLLPDELPFQLEDLSPAGIIQQIIAFISYLIQLFFKVLSAIFQFLVDIFGQWTIPILLLAIVIIVLISLTPSKKKRSSGTSEGGGS